MDVIEAYYLIECTRLTSSSTEGLSGFVEQVRVQAQLLLLLLHAL